MFDYVNNMVTYVQLCLAYLPTFFIMTKGKKDILKGNRVYY